MEAVTAEYVAGYRFSTARRGYDPIEVDQLLRRIAAELERLEAIVAERSGREDSAVLMLRHASKAAEGLLAEAEEVAEGAKAGARIEAEEILTEARNEATAVVAEAQRRERDISERLVRNLEEAESTVAAAYRDADERVAHSRSVLAERANRLRVEADMLVHMADRLELSSDSTQGRLIDLTDVDHPKTTTAPVSDIAGAG